VAEYGGRVWFSKSGSTTPSWTEVRPLGDTNQNWEKVALLPSSSYDNFLYAATTTRAYISFDYGDHWEEIQPAGDIDRLWKCVLYYNYKKNIILGDYGGRIYLATTGQSTSSYNATLVGNVDLSTVDSLSVKLNYTSTSNTTAEGDIIIDDFYLIGATSLVKDFSSGYPVIDETNFEITTESYLSSLDANGFLINSIGTFNEDSSPLMQDVFMFTPLSKSSSDEFIFRVKNRLVRK
jgi:hypothetical protein